MCVLPKAGGAASAAHSFRDDRNRVNLVVFLEANLFSIQAEFIFQNKSHFVHHGLQAADVSFKIPPSGEKLAQMLLDISCFARPVRGRTAQRGEKVKARILRSEILKFAAIENRLGMADAEDEPYIVGNFLASVENFGEHAANRRDACAGRDKNEILFDGRRNDERAVRAIQVHRRTRTGVEIAEVIRNIAAFDTIQAKVEGFAVARSRRNGVGARFLAAIARDFERNKLTGVEFEGAAIDDFPLEMFGGGRESADAPKSGAEFSRRNEWSCRHFVGGICDAARFPW